jgi:hypothetical protein
MITYSYKVDSIRTANVGDLQNVIKQVNYTATGTESDKSFSLPGKVVLDDPNPESFINFENLTESQVIAWIEERPENLGIKNHIKLVVDKMVAEASLQEKTLPWAPAVPIVEPGQAPVVPA